MSKLILYVITMPIVVYATDSININNIFKKNRLIQARLFYMLVIFSLSYLVTNFLYDFLTTFNK